MSTETNRTVPVVVSTMTPTDDDPAYHCVDPAAIDPTPDHPCDRRSISEAIDLSVLAAAVYEIEPGEQLPRSYHYHEQREELFFVQSGTLHVETPDGDFEREAGELFVAEPNSPHRPHNPDAAEQSTVVLGVGAPRSDIALPVDPDD